MRSPEAPRSWYDLPIFTARDLKESVALSYRMIFDWQQRGAYVQQRRKRSWRRFTANQTAQLAVIKCLTMAGVPIAELTPLIQWLNRDLTSVIEHSLRLADSYLVTDLTEVFTLCGSSGLAAAVRKGFATTRGAPAKPKVHLHIVSLEVVANALRTLAARSGYVLGRARARREA